MAEIKDTGYISLRKFITKEWNKLVLLDDEGEEVIEVDIEEDHWIHERDEEEVYAGKDPNGAPVYDNEEYESNAEMEIEITIKGSDFDSDDLPVKVEKSQIREGYSLDEEERTVTEESFDSFEFESSNDELTINHVINVPVSS